MADMMFQKKAARLPVQEKARPSRGPRLQDNRGAALNRGAFYQHPNGAPPASGRHKISAAALTMLTGQAARQGFSLRARDTSGVSFHKPMDHGNDCIFHVYKG